MITRIVPAWQTENWQKSLAESIRDPAELLDFLELPQNLLPAALQASRHFPLRVTRAYLSRIEKANPADPLLLQVLPLGAELEGTPSGYCSDPVGDLNANPVPGLIHKYHARVLLITTGACAIHCRYCFRRHFPYGETSSTAARLDEILAYIRSDESIEEIILSGGDPLCLSTHRLWVLTRQLADISHLRRLRIHTRLPIVLPDRVNTQLLDWLTHLPLQPIMVIHCNHPRELDDNVRHALRKLSDSGVKLLNQSVLLRGINDSVEALKSLSEALFDANVMPYYLHQLDRVTGSHHFEIADDIAKELLVQLSRQLPGYMIPKLVREISGEKAKVALC